MVDWSGEIRDRLVPLDLSAEREFEIAEELGQHLGDRYAELRARGASDADAQRTVRDELQRAPLIDALARSERASALMSGARCSSSRTVRCASASLAPRARSSA